MDFMRVRGSDPEIHAAIEDAFEYHTWDEQMEAGKKVRRALADAVKVIVEVVPPSADRSAAIRKIREARMDANSAITHNGNSRPCPTNPCRSETSRMSAVNHKQEPTVATGAQSVTISAPNFRVVKLRIVGAPNSALVINRFSSKQQAMVRETQAAGQTAKSKRKRDPKDFDALYQQCMYRSPEGWYGFNASSIRNAAISACRVAGFAMTKAKLAIFTIADGMDAEDGTPLVRIYGEPKQWTSPVRNASGVIDLRSRARFDDWSAVLTIRFDADMFTATDIANLVMRIGLQVGIGEGRPDSKDSCGIGMGLFNIASEETQEVAARRKAYRDAYMAAIKEFSVPPVEPMGSGD